VSGFKIGSIYAFLAIDPKDGDEGVCAFQTSDGAWFPLVAADEARLASLRPIAMRIGAASGTRIILARFSTRTDLEIVTTGGVRREEEEGEGEEGEPPMPESSGIRNTLKFARKPRPAG